VSAGLGSRFAPLRWVLFAPNCNLDFDFDPDSSVLNPERICLDFGQRIHGRTSRLELKLPLMPGTDNDAPSDPTLVQGGTAMRAGLVERVEVALVVEDGDAFLTDVDGERPARGDVAHGSNSVLHS
jgi:hypothetical protein